MYGEDSYNYADEKYANEQSGNQFDFLQFMKTIKNVFVKRKMEKRRKKIIRRRRKQIKRSQGFVVSSDSSSSSGDEGNIVEDSNLYGSKYGTLSTLTPGGDSMIDHYDSVRNYMPPLNVGGAYSANLNHHCFQCSRPLTDVRKLNCGHAFCSNCLDSHIYGGTIQCPVCQHVTNLKGIASNTLLPAGGQDLPSIPYHGSASQPVLGNARAVLSAPPGTTQYWTAPDQLQSYSSPSMSQPLTQLPSPTTQTPSWPTSTAEQTMPQQLTSSSTSFNYPYSVPHIYQAAPSIPQSSYIHPNVEYTSPKVRYIKPSVYRAAVKKDDNKSHAVYMDRKRYADRNMSLRSASMRPQGSSGSKLLYVDSKLELGDKILTRIQEVQCPPKFANTTTIERFIEMLLVHDKPLSTSGYHLKVRSKNGRRSELSKKMTIADCDLNDGDTIYLRKQRKSSGSGKYEELTEKYNTLEEIGASEYTGRKFGQNRSAKEPKSTRNDDFLF
ncbi:hypothetical protein ACOME3_009090 [Neoechinorhynchus agilis]